ncbi:MAG: 3-dehydroquinate synthase [Eubacteriales bacterium]
MEQILTVNKGKQILYEIQIQDSFDQLESALNTLELNAKNMVIVTDSTVGPIYAAQIAGICQRVVNNVAIFTFPCGEAHKTLNTVTELYRFLIEHNIERGDLLIALGGGVVGDLTGYTAATYLRGMAFIQIPTTLLSQVDSSIGGKTGVDFDQYKNMVGAFHMPKLVYTNIATLQTLDSRQFASGMAEVLKAGLIKDAVFYEWLITNFNEIGELEDEVLVEMIYRSCMIKKRVVEKDPFEKGERAILNFGHTIGHAIEKSKNFQLHHGECVALGCIAASYISYKRGLLSTEEYYEIRDMFVPFQLRIMATDLNPEQVLKDTKSDKKRKDGVVQFILLKKIGKAIIDKTVSDQEILEAIEEVYDREEIQND